MAINPDRIDTQIVQSNQRCKFFPYDKDVHISEESVKSYNWFYAVACRIWYGIFRRDSGIIKLTDSEGHKFYLDKANTVTWINTQRESPLTDQDKSTIIQAINLLCLPPAPLLSYRLGDMSKSYSSAELKKLRAVKTGYINMKDTVIKDYLDGHPPSGIGRERGCDIVRVKEKATLNALQSSEYGKMIEDGVLDPASIAFEMKMTLKVNDDIPPSISKEKLNSLNPLEKEQKLAEVEKKVHEEIDSFEKKGFLIVEQQNRIKKDISEAIPLYAKAYSDKTVEDLFVVVRDMARVAFYQELSEPGVFSGSDHGSKHIHHNHELAKEMFPGIDKEHLSAKDRFLVMFTHFYHDLGYTLGISTNDFLASRDHPIHGAKFIAENASYFTHYLGKEGFEAVRDSILYHAIPDAFTKEVERDTDVHYSMVRATSSISDSCAVTSERKTQDFWLKPKAISVLVRLKLYLLIHPEMQKFVRKKKPIATLGNREEEKFVEFYNKMKDELRQIAKDDPFGRSEAFLKAIENNFNSFTANITLGQYTAKLDSVSVTKEHGHYVPQISMVPSAVQHYLKELYGDDAGAKAFTKLIEDMGGDEKVLQSKVLEHAHRLHECEEKKMSASEYPKVLELRTDMVIFRILSKIDYGTNIEMQKYLKELLGGSIRYPIAHAIEDLLKLNSSDRIQPGLHWDIRNAFFGELRTKNVDPAHVLKAVDFFENLPTTPISDADWKEKVEGLAKLGITSPKELEILTV